MARQPLTPSQKRYRRRSWIITLTATVIFLAGVFAMKPLIDRPARSDDLLALIGGFIVLNMAVIAAVAHLVAPKDMAMPRRGLATVMTCATSGAALLLPIVGERLIDPMLNFAIVLALSAASFWFVWLIWRAADELHRTLMKEGYAANYLVLVTALGVYATGERLGLFGGVTAWGALAVATIAGFVISNWIVIRHGLNRPPAD